jgi:histidine ammonia-lyase
VGKLSDVRIAPEQIRELQMNLLRSHAAGVGLPLSESATRAMLLLRANSLAKGLSGVRAVVIDTLCEMLNRGVHPIVPSQGSVGAREILLLLHIWRLCWQAKGKRFTSDDASLEPRRWQRLR